MFGIHDLGLFMISGLLLNMAPGPDSLLIVTRSAAQGWRAGSAAALGIGSGTLIHIIAAALGLSAILATSATAFSVVKYIGAIYLLYIGVGLLLSKTAAVTPVADENLAPLSLRRIYVQGFLTNLFNPKVAIFFLAFVPQFISPQAENKALAFILLGCIFNLNGMLWCHLLAVTSAMASQRLQASRAVSQWLNRLIGALFISFGIKLALVDR
ncbi:LysE family translocator [Deefgea sp. CFH1-16]|uniref:LysE family translocator n=1 Tax=Deefgea sp. CFH1-16 TaxID=2675457 RepID=UPI0015F72500|nr:LysE family translocator [Deefgea sp. CFH1-16]MBM5574522.1 LysE family translocator [Deefgea sp. CFH1-16]